MPLVDTHAAMATERIQQAGCRVRAVAAAMKAAAARIRCRHIRYHYGKDAQDKSQWQECRHGGLLKHGKALPCGYGVIRWPATTAGRVRARMERARQDSGEGYRAASTEHRTVRSASLSRPPWNCGAREPWGSGGACGETVELRAWRVWGR